jgi:adenylate kinase family enzyme
MERIAIIGSSGTGKSTLARDLGRLLHINVVHLDRVFWEPGWKEKPRETRIDILQEIVRKEQWIIEGTYLGTAEPRLNAADTIIFLDTPALLCLKRVIKRYMGGGRCHREIPEGCYDRLSLFRILKVMVFPFKGKRTLKRKLLYYKSMPKHIIKLGSPKEVDSFLAQLEAQANENKQSSRMPSTPRKRQLAVARR